MAAAGAIVKSIGATEASAKPKETEVSLGFVSSVSKRI